AGVLLPRLEPGRGEAAAVQRLLQRPDVQHPVLDEGVVRLARVVLEFVVAPPADPLAGLVVVEPVAGVEVPPGLVDVLAVELVGPDQLPLDRGGLGALVGREQGHPGGGSEDQDDPKPATTTHGPAPLLPKPAFPYPVYSLSINPCKRPQL